MTTIAWDGLTLAADKQSTCSGLIHKTTKIFKHWTGLYGVTGHLTHGLTVYKWITEQNADPALYPENPSSDDYGYVLHINVDSEIFCYEGYAIPAQMEDKFIAVGSGRDFATAAMYLGQTAVQAIATSSIFDANTGNGVDSFTLEDVCELR